MNAYAFSYDRQIARPGWRTPRVRANRIVLPLFALDRDISLVALLPGTRGITRAELVNGGSGAGELVLFPSAPLAGRYAFSLVLRYSDGIQHVDDRLEAEVLVPAEPLRIRFTEHGTVRVDLPVALAVTATLTDPGAYRIEALETATQAMQVRSVGREERRPDAAGMLRPVSDPTYLELFVTGGTTGIYRLHLPALPTAAGGVFGPVSRTFVARLVKRGFAERTLGPKSGHAHEIAPGIVISAIFAEDERAGGREGGRG
jgi:hypothetical protein